MARGGGRPQPTITDDRALGSADIQRSLRFNASNTNLTRTSSSASTTFTYSAWIKRCGFSGYQYIFSMAGRGFSFHTNNQTLYLYDANNLNESSAKFRDSTAWYHIVVQINLGTATSYVNGVLVHNGVGGGAFTLTTGANETRIGSYSENEYDFDGYMAEINLVDGSVVAPTEFGFTDPQTGIWMPKRFDKSFIPNKKGTTFSASGWTVSGGGGFSGSKPITNAYNGSIGTSNSDVANNSAGGATLTWDTSAYNLTGNLKIFCWSDGGEYDIYVNGNSGNTTKVGDTPSGSGNAAWIDCGTFDHIKEIQFSGTTYNTDTGLGSSGVYIAGFFVNGTLLRDDMPEYGTNGFYLDFSDNTSTTTLGIDKSPNGNDFTLNNFDVNDSVEDTPTNAFCTMNVLDGSAGTQLTATNGNLRVYTSHGFRTMRGTLGVSSGKWYWESRLISWASSFIGVTGGDEDITGTGRGGETSNSAMIRQNNGDIRTSGSNSSYGNSQADGDILGFALDMDNGKFYISENGTFYNSGDPVNGTNAAKTGLTGTVFPSAAPYDGKSCYFNFGQDDTFDGNETSQGNTDGNGHGKFKYAPPTGFLSLCTANLPASTSILRPKKHFDVLTYTGTATGSGTQTISDLEFAPDFVWIKSRAIGYSHLLVDTVRGASKGLLSEDANVEETSNQYGMVTSFRKNGFTMTRGSNDGGKCCENTQTYVAWCWKAGGAAVSNSDGAITSSVSVNDEAGFSIVSYSGNGNSTATIGHGLSKAPKWIITKCRSTSTHADWPVWHEELSDNENVYLNQVNSETTPSYGHITDPTSTLINVSKGSGNQTNASGQTYISYCWSEIPGYSKFGKYTGDGNADGAFVNLGFRPAFVLVKGKGFAGNWNLFDIKRPGLNPTNDRLFPNLSDAESDGSSSNNQIDILSDGFKIRGSNVDTNSDGAEYIYMAFAEQPGTTSFDTISNAR